MLDDTHSLDLSRKDLALIEAALHTQHKILSVQSQGGGAGATSRMTEVAHLIKRVKRKTSTSSVSVSPSWAQMARSLFC